MGQRLFAQVVQQARGGVDHLLHRRVLGVQDAQRIAVQAALGFGVQDVFVFFQIHDQVGAVAVALFGIADRVQFETHVLQAQVIPQAARHHDHLGVDVRAREADRFGAELEELAVAAALRTLVAEHRALVPQAARAVVDQVVLEHGAHDAGRAFRTQGQLVAVHRVFEGIHLLLDDVGDGADGAREQARLLDDRGHDLLVAVAFQDRFGGVLEQLPQRRVLRQDVVHAFDGDDFFWFGHGRLLSL